MPVWHSGIPQIERIDIERIKKSAAHIILGEEYSSYKDALSDIGLKSLEARRAELCLKFLKKTKKHEKHQNWLELYKTNVNSRKQKNKFCDVKAFLYINLHSS